MKYTRYKVGDRVELVDVTFLKNNNGKLVDTINPGIIKKNFVPTLRGAKEFKHFEWDAVELDYLLVEVTRVRTITASNPIVEGVVIHRSGPISEEIGLGDKMYIHEDLREFVPDAIVSRYVWSNYIVDPNKPVIDYAVWCLSDYEYLEKMFRDRQLSGVAKAKLSKKLIRDAIEDARTTARLEMTRGHEVQTYRKYLDLLLADFGKDIRALTFCYRLTDYDDFIATVCNKISELFDIRIQHMCRIMISDNRDNTLSIPIVEYRVIFIMRNSDYMLWSRDSNPRKNEIFKAINSKIVHQLNNPQNTRTRFFIENMNTFVIANCKQPDPSITALMHFLFEQ